MQASADFLKVTTEPGNVLLAGALLFALFTRQHFGRGG